MPGRLRAAQAPDICATTERGRRFARLLKRGTKACKARPAEEGRYLLKQARTHMAETARPVMMATVEQVTGAKVLSLHLDVSTVTAQEDVLSTLGQTPARREAGRSWKTSFRAIVRGVLRRGLNRLPEIRVGFRATQGR